MVDDGTRRAELAAFLKTRRAQVDRAAVGLPAARRNHRLSTDGHDGVHVVVYTAADRRTATRLRRLGRA